MACLGDASRFRLVQALCGGARCVTDLASEVGLSQSCTTRHLQALERRRVVCGARDGKRVMYRLCHEEPALGRLLAWALSPEGVGLGAPPPVPEGGGDAHHDIEGGRAGHAPADRSAPHAAPSGTLRPVSPNPKRAETAAPSSASQRAALASRSPGPTARTDIAQSSPPARPMLGGSGMPWAEGEVGGVGGAASEPAPVERPLSHRSRHHELEDYLL